LGRLGGSEAIDVRLTLTREQPDGWEGYAGRVDRAMLEDVAWPAREQPRVYVCGPTGFVESAAQILVELGHEPGRIKTERFGASGS
jgi:ferredoxin-NADP reductase